MHDAGAFYDASLCVSELVTNAVLHAAIGGDAELRLDVELDGDGKLRVQVIDPGRGFTPPEPTPGDDSGWGLFLVDRLSDRWGVREGDGTCVWFEMSLAEKAPAASSGSTARPAAPGPVDGRESGMRNRVAGRFGLGAQPTG